MLAPVLGARSRVVASPPSPTTPTTTRSRTMRARGGLAFASAFVLAAVVTGQDSSAAKSNTGPKTLGKSPTALQPSDMKWTELDPSRPGVKVADVSGDHTKG